MLALCDKIVCFSNQIFQMFGNQSSTSLSAQASTSTGPTAQQLPQAAQQHQHQKQQLTQPPDLIGSLLGTTGCGSSTCGGPQYHHLTSTGSNNCGGSHYGLGMMMAGRNVGDYWPTSMPRRRYSLGGPPDFQEQQINNLLSETTRSISRSMQILCSNNENLSSLPTTDVNALNLDSLNYDLMAAAAASGSNNLSNTFLDGGTATNSSNLLAMASNFYSHPNIYSPFGGGGGGGTLPAKYQSPLLPSSHHGFSATGSGPLFQTYYNNNNNNNISYDQSPLTTSLPMSFRKFKPNSSYMHSKPMYSYQQQPLSSLYHLQSLSPPPQQPSSYSILGTSPLCPYGMPSAPYSTTAAAMSRNLYSSLPHSNSAAHYGSHPTISKYTSPRHCYGNNNMMNSFSNNSQNISSYLRNTNTTTGHNSNNFLHHQPPPPHPGYVNPYSSNYFGNNSQSRYHHYLQQPSSQQQPYQQQRHHSSYNNYYHQPSSSSSAYRTGSGTGYYPSGHYRAINNYSGLSKAAATVGGGSSGSGVCDMKRQVSFKFDVDTLSIESS